MLNGAVPLAGKPAAGPWALVGRVVTPTHVLVDGAVVIEGTRIAWVGPATDAPGPVYREAVEVARAGQAAQGDDPEGGPYILPGLVDLHCHGGGGQSFPDAATVGEAQQAAFEHLAHGTTSLVASLVTASPAVLVRQAAMLADLAEAGEIVGIHSEGPFLSPCRAGAQNPAALQTPDPGLVRQLAEAARGHLVTMTLAPELAGNVANEAGVPSVTEQLVEVGAVPSFGHTDCSAAEMDRAIAEARAALAHPGARSRRPTITHLFNGMRPFNHRDPGPIFSSLAGGGRQDVVVELVADGVHLDRHTVSGVFDLLGPHCIALVTDAMAAAGMPDGNYTLGSLDVVVAGGVARLAPEPGATEPGSIAGGTAHLLDVVRTTVWEAGVPLHDAVCSASRTPARVLGLAAELGSIAPELRADLIVADAQLKPLEVIRHGRVVARNGQVLKATASA